MFLKRVILLLTTVVLLLPLTGCNNGKTDDKEESGDRIMCSSKVRELIPSQRAASVWKGEWADEENGFSDESKIYGFDLYRNGELSETDASKIDNDDCKYLFYGESDTRAVNLAEGYAMTLPTTSLTVDYSLGMLRTRYYGDNFLLTVTKENQNPYGNNENGWNIYFTEWIDRYIGSLEYLANNKLRYSRAKQENKDLLPGYTVYLYNIQFRLKIDYKYQNYDIAVVRKDGEYVQFYLFVMKSTEKQVELLDNIVKSLTEFSPQGKAVNKQGAYELKIPEFWSEETKKYFNMLREQNDVSWGAFSASMPEDSDGTYESKLNMIKEDQQRLETAFDYKLDILPTYTPISWYDNYIDFPSGIASELAGGNGFNGKPVLQFTYQYTNSNNLGGTTPVFDVIDGKYDGQFRKIAQQIKAYEKPVLFRLNNEMNTDWTSYSGFMNLLDPDLYIESWQKLYNIFREEGVDNCIWIFNPIAVSCPYSNWSEYLCYMPGEDYMQMLGLTYYEMNNGIGKNASVKSFKEMYTYLYNKNMPYYENYPWIISEFGCAAGGKAYYDWGSSRYVESELGRNSALQAEWVSDMFECFNNNQEAANAFCRNIKAAVWFSVNDYADVGGKSTITNYLQLNDELTETLEEFRKGLNKE